MDTYWSEKPGMTLIGVSTRTTNARESGPEGRIPKLWDIFSQSGLSAYFSIVDPHLIYVLYTDYESDVSGAYTIVIGHETGRGEPQADNGRTYASIPESEYMVFRTEKGPVHQVVPQAWGVIWEYFRNSGEERAYTGDFEVYDVREFDPANVELEIYVAIK